MQKNKLSILCLNTFGQTKLTLQKQLQIQDIIKSYKTDVVHLQETDSDDNTFKKCNYILNNYTVISNNSPTGYGTMSLVKNDLKVDNISLDTAGRIIVFEIDNITHCNVYLEAGTDSNSRSAREQYLSDTLPNLLINRCSSGYLCGDWNCISDKRDATNHPDSKLSKSLNRLMKVFELKDSHRILFPSATDYSHFYSAGQINGATRIDRQYIWEAKNVRSSEYIPVAFSDHYGLVINLSVPFSPARQIFPQGSRSFKIKKTS